MQAFAYSVSHDLRAPIRAIEGFSKILLEDYGAKLDPEAGKFLQHIIANTQTLSSQIEDLLRYYRIAKTPPRKIEVNTSEILAQVVQDELAKAKSAGVDVTIDKVPKACGDPELLRQFFGELVGNALKFTRNTRSAKVSLGGKIEKEEAVLWVKDNGVGFDMRYGNKLFQVFQKLHPVAEFPGNGIGLAFARRIAELHGGRIWAEAAPGKGATFFLALPGKC